MADKAPRALTISFEIRVPPGLPANIRGARVDTAVSRIVGAVQGLVPAVFPWADRVIVRHDWSYRWVEAEEEIVFPETDDNTVPTEASAEA